MFTSGLCLRAIKSRSQLALEGDGLIRCEITPQLVSKRLLIVGECSDTAKLSYEAKRFEAVQFLLEAGADPNVGDDEQMYIPPLHPRLYSSILTLLRLPVFVALGFRCRKRTTSLVQFPPPTSAWLDILRLLVHHESSVHEVVWGKTLSMLNINRSDYPESTTTDFYKILLGEQYIDFDSNDGRGWSAMYSAVRSGQKAIEALDFLANHGVNMKNILTDGRTVLHLAAELADDSEVLEHIYNAYDMKDVDRQDKLGWTALHYAVRSAKPSRKARFLLEKGANPYIKANEGPLSPIWLKGTTFTPFELAHAWNKDRALEFIEDLRTSGHALPTDVDDIFYDAQQGCI